MSHSVLPQLKPKDFASDQEVRWCPGCGDYAILKAIQKTLADLQVPRENSVFISGIGCSSHFPYYMATYGFHTIHGRAPAVATGTKLANPDLDVWVITGDGDGLSIGGNHLVHALRRNVDLNIILFNNEIYGLTKGQVSPTSKQGTLSPTTPRGSVANPISPATMALGVGARFVARSVDINQAHLVDVLKQAHANAGTSFVEIFQNCIVFNDATFADFTDKSVAKDNQLLVEHGQPLLFGAERDRGLRLDPATWTLEVVRPRALTCWCMTRPTGCWRPCWPRSNLPASQWHSGSCTGTRPPLSTSRCWRRSSRNPRVGAWRTCCMVAGPGKWTAERPAFCPFPAQKMSPLACAPRRCRSSSTVRTSHSSLHLHFP